MLIRQENEEGLRCNEDYVTIRSTRSGHEDYSFYFVCLLASMNLVAQPKAGKKAGGETPQFKAIWEPVPYPKDINLFGIACVGAESCYAVGEKGTVIFKRRREDVDGTVG
jgi:hypothetical protein